MSKNSKESEQIPEMIRDENRNVVYKKGVFFGKVGDAYSRFNLTVNLNIFLKLEFFFSF